MKRSLGVYIGRFSPWHKGHEADDPMFKMAYKDCQGFVDQFGNYYTRSQAMLLQRINMQPFNYKRNGGGSDTELYSEGKY